MSKSMQRVRRALDEAGLDAQIIETGGARSAEEAAAAVDCDIDQIAKSIVLAAPDGEVVLFLTAGGRQVDMARASALAGAALSRADAAQVRARTGFAIGGVAPVGHIATVRAWADRRLLDFDRIWAAAGTPRHVVALNPADLCRISGAQVADFTAPSKKM